MNSEFGRYLRILGVERSEPTLALLSKLVHAQLNCIPYENGSKLLQLSRGEIRLPTLPEYLDGNERFGFGGTCFAQNLYFYELLGFLGFKASLIFVAVDGNRRNHVSVRVGIAEDSYIVDFGFLDAFAGPFDESTSPVSSVLGGRTFRFLPKPDGHFRFEIYRGNGELQRGFDSEGEITDLAEITPAVEASFDPAGSFLRKIFLGLRTSNPGHSIWDGFWYKSSLDTVAKHAITDLEDLRRIVQVEMNLPQYPIDDVVRALEGRGIEVFLS